MKLHASNNNDVTIQRATSYQTLTPARYCAKRSMHTDSSETVQEPVRQDIKLRWFQRRSVRRSMLTYSKS